MDILQLVENLGIQSDVILVSTLQQLTVVLRDDEIRSNPAVTDAILKVISLYSKSQETVKLGCLKVIANAVADTESNRKLVLDQKEFLDCLREDLTTGETPSLVNLIIINIYNLSMDFDPAIQYFRKWSSIIIESCLKYRKSESLSLENLFRLIPLLQSESHSFPVETVDLLLQELSEDPDTVAPLILSDQEFEKYIAKDSDKFLELFKVVFYLMDQNSAETDEILDQQLFAIIGNISSYDEFCEHVDLEISSTPENLFTLLASNISSYQGIKTGSSCCVIGNLASDTSRVQKIYANIPEILDHYMGYWKLMKRPFELQSAHMVKNLTLGRFEEKILGIDPSLINELYNCKLFVQLRILGVQIARNVFRAEKQLNEKILDLTVSLYLREDDSSVISEIVRCYIVILDTVSAQALGTKNWTHMIQVLGSQALAMIEAKQISQNSLLLSVTKTLGVTVSKSSSSSPLERSDDFMEQLDKIFKTTVKVQTDNLDDIGKGIINNIGFIAAKVVSVSETNSTCANKMIEIATRHG